MEGAAQTLVSNVGQLVGAEFRQLRGVGGEVARLRNQLATINALLRMQSEAGEDAVDHFVREWMKQLREVGYDAEDCVDLYLFRVRSRPGDHLFVRCKRLLTTLWSRRRLASDIRELRAHASDINEQHASYGATHEALRRPLAAAASAGPVQASVAVRALRPGTAAAIGGDPGQNNKLVGNEAQATDLANKVKELRNNNEKDKQLKVFSIVGFGGLGRTTLAVEVCRKLQKEFERQALVSVSQTFSPNDLQGLLRSVVRQIAQPKLTEGTAKGHPVDDGLQGGVDDKRIPERGFQSLVKQSYDSMVADPLGDIDNMPVDDLQRELETRLQNKRYLILIDDVWSTSAWDAIRSKLPSSNCGSRIIVTTRIDTVARACSEGNEGSIHHMKKLHDNQSKQLFVSRAFGSRVICLEGLEDAMTNILKKCGGLPLAIVSIASLLATYKLPECKEMWETVQKSIGSQMESNPTLEGMREILTLSYTHLPHHLKACMMYLSIFPEDCRIVKDRLLKRWIAEGLIAKKRGLTKMELAEGYFDELVSKSMIDCADGKEETCRVHDMMLEILVSKSLEANFVSLVGGQYEGMSYTNTIRRLSIHGGALAEVQNKSTSMKSTVVARRGMQNGIKGMTMEHVRSLSIFDPEAHKLLARLDEFTLLRVLDLEDCKGLEQKHMNYICQMYLLRFLSLKGTNINVMPSGVGNLEHLETLDVRRTCLDGLPITVTRLEKLEHLLFSNKDNFWHGLMLPQGINKMKALHQLNKAVVMSDLEVANQIGELYQLQELSIYVDTTNTNMREHEYAVAEKLACSLSKLYSLRWLDIGNLGCGNWPFVPIMDFLHKVEPPPRLLRYLKICGHMSSGLPDWLGSLNDLVEINISWTYLDGAELFNVLCKLPRLKRLSLEGFFIRNEQMVFEGNNEDMVFEGNNEDMVFEGNNEDMIIQERQSLEELKELTLGYAPGGIPKIYIFGEGSMPKLEKLVVYFGDEMKQVVGIEKLKNLKEVQYTGHKAQIEDEVDRLNNLITEGKVSKTVAFKVNYFDEDDMLYMFNRS